MADNWLYMLSCLGSLCDLLRTGERESGTRGGNRYWAVKKLFVFQPLPSWYIYLWSNIVCEMINHPIYNEFIRFLPRYKYLHKILWKFLTCSHLSKWILIFKLLWSCVVSAFPVCLGSRGTLYETWMLRIRSRKRFQRLSFNHIVRHSDEKHAAWH